MAAMDGEHLIAIGRRLARPIARLVAEPRGEPIGAWLADDDRSGPTRLRVDVSAHPESFEGAAIARAYEAWWWRETAWRAEDVYAQLGGWPITWPDEAASDQLRAPLALRTYRGAEPWLEVFWQRPVYVVRARAT